MLGLGPGIHDSCLASAPDVDARVKPAHDESIIETLA